jgi:hypothetical protein
MVQLVSLAAHASTDNDYITEASLEEKGHRFKAEK